MAIVDLTPKFSIPTIETELIFPANISDSVNQLIGGLTAGSRELTQGKIRIQGIDERILLGDVEDYSTGVGVYIGKDPSDNLYKFRAGDPEGAFLAWDGALLSIVGFLEDGEAAGDINTHSTTIDGGKITALSVTASQIAANTITGAKIAAGTITASNIATGTITASLIAANTITASEIASNAITADEIASNAITASKIQAGAITASKISTPDLASINANLGTITAGTINASNVSVTNLSATNINNGTLSVGASGKVSQIIIDQNTEGNAYLRFGSSSGSRIWVDSNSYMGFNALGGQMYFYVDSYQKLVLNSNSQAVIGYDATDQRTGLFIWGTLNNRNGNVRFADAQVRINTSSSPSEQLYVEGSGKFVGNLATNHHDPRSSNSYNLGGSSAYWAYVNCHDVTYHSLGFYDDGVTVEKNGELVKVSDVEAIKLMKPHPTLKTKDGAPLIDKFSLPKEMFESAKRLDGTEYKRDPKTGYPIVDDPEIYFDKNGNEKKRKKEVITPDADGQSGGQLLALALGAVRELSNEIELLKQEIIKLKNI